MYCILKYINGYLYIKVSGPATQRFMNLCGARKILLWKIRKVDDGYEMYVSRKAFFQMKDIAFKTSSKVEILKKIGLPFFVGKIQHKWYFIFLLLLIILIGFVSQYFLWNIEIEGEQEIQENEIMEYLSQSGVKKGILKKTIDISGLEQNLRNDFDSITWVSAYLEQNTLMIVLCENDKKLIEQKGNQEEYHICVTKDGTVKSIITRTGTPLVQIGDAVKKGDYLVLGSVQILDQNENPLYQEGVEADADIMIETTIKKQFRTTRKELKTYRSGQKKSYPYLAINGHIYPIKILQFPFREYEIVLPEQKKDYSIFGSTLSGGILYVYEVCQKEEVKTNEMVEEELRKSLSEYVISLKEKGIQILSKNVKIKKNMDVATLDVVFLVDGPFYKKVECSDPNKDMEILENTSKRI